jgi:hypothetical protein
MCNGGCGNHYDYDDTELSKEDRMALLVEKKAIYQAKLATLNHWIEELDKEEKPSEKK